MWSVLLSQYCGCGTWRCILRRMGHVHSDLMSGMQHVSSPYPGLVNVHCGFGQPDSTAEALVSDAESRLIYAGCYLRSRSAVMGLPHYCCSLLSLRRSCTDIVVVHGLILAFSQADYTHFTHQHHIRVQFYHALSKLCEEPHTQTRRYSARKIYKGRRQVRYIH
jgi:hypothetical protein